MSRSEILENTIEELTMLGLVMQLNGMADPRIENPLSALVDAIEDPGSGRSIAGTIEQLLSRELDSIHFTNAEAVMEFLLDSDRFIGSLTHIGIVTEKNTPTVDEVAKEVYSRAIQLYAEQYHKQEKQKWLEQAKPARYDTEGRLR